MPNGEHIAHLHSRHMLSRLATQILHRSSFRHLSIVFACVIWSLALAARPKINLCDVAQLASTGSQSAITQENTINGTNPERWLLTISGGTLTLAYLSNGGLAS